MNIYLFLIIEINRDTHLQEEVSQDTDILVLTMEKQTIGGGFFQLRSALI